MNYEEAFLLDNVLFNLRVKDDILQLKLLKKEEDKEPSVNLDKSFKLVDVIATQYEPDLWKEGKNGELVLEKGIFNFFQLTWSDCFSFTIIYCEKSSDHTRRLRTLKLQTKHEKTCSYWKEIITQEVEISLKKVSQVRPKNILVVVNPYAGSKRGRRDYYNLVSPLCKKCGVKESVFFTQHEGHAIEYLEFLDLSPYDGVIAMGGDGTFNEVVNGVLLNRQLKLGITINRDANEVNEPADLAKPSVRLGLIPSGAGNTLNITSQGLRDPETSLLHVIFGESHPLDIFSVNDNEGNFIRFGVLMSVKGVMSDMILLSEKLRIFGRIRYHLSSVFVLATLQSFEGEILYLPSSCTSAEDSKCVAPCAICTEDSNAETQGRSRKKSENLDNNLNGEASSPQYGLYNLAATRECASAQRSEIGHQNEKNMWKAIRGPFLMTTLVNTAFKYDEKPDGIVPNAHLADGAAELIVVRDAPRKEFLRYFGSTYSKKESKGDFPFVERQRVKAVRFFSAADYEHREKHNANKNSSHTKQKSLSRKHHVSADDRPPQESSTHKFVVDGEKVNNPNFTIWMHRGLINIFAKGFEGP